MEYRIRLAELDDLDCLSPFWEAMVEETREQVPNLGILTNSGGYFLQFAGVGLTTGGCGLYMAENKDSIMGFVMGQIVTPEPPFSPERYGYISALFVGQEWRSKGIGRALVRSMTQWFAGRGINRMELHVYVENQNSVEFWRSVGFAPLGLRMGSLVNPLLKPGPGEE